MKIILNHKGQNHFDVISKELMKAKKVKVAVAFLKQSGLNKLRSDIDKALKRNVKFEFYIGLSFGTSDASALKELFQIAEGNGLVNLYLLYPKSNVTFYPKVRLFQNGNEANIISGSANLTNGGLSLNHKCSILYNTTMNDLAYKKLNQYFEDIVAFPKIVAFPFLGQI